LLRCLTALAADAPRGTFTADDRVPSTYGLPDSERVLESGGNRVFLWYEGNIATGSQEVISIPIPRAFAAGASHRELRVALAFDPPVRRSRRDYIAGRMTFQVVAKLTFDELKARFEAQPSLRARTEDPSLEALAAAEHLNLRPPKTTLSADTLISRVYDRPAGGWDQDDEHYHLVISHEHSPWTQSQKDRYTSQRYAVVVELIDHGRPQLDLFAQVQTQLREQTRARARTDGRR
jgi:hypothetical protein